MEPDKNVSKKERVPGGPLVIEMTDGRKHPILIPKTIEAYHNLMRDILARFDYPGKSPELTPPDPDIAFEFTLDCIGSKRLAR